MPKHERSCFLRRVLSRVTFACLSLARRIKTIFNISVEYKVGSYSISLPAYHLLPLYQKQHRLYDRFLPHLAGLLEANSVVVDVGANCGDTVVAMYEANRVLNYVCIEPDEVFFSYLTRNISRLKKNDVNASINAVRALVGKSVDGVVLDGSGGTKRAVFSNESTFISSKTLDAIVAAKSLQKVRLLKSDVDGFDFDVLDSASLTLNSNFPILYFECDVYQESQKNGFQVTIENLWKIGYKKWIVFDNFGDVVFRDASVKQVHQLIDYIWRQNLGKSTRTIFYFDFLAAVDNDDNFVDDVIDRYILKYSDN